MGNAANCPFPPRATALTWSLPLDCFLSRVGASVSLTGSAGALRPGPWSEAGSPAGALTRDEMYRAGVWRSSFQYSDDPAGTLVGTKLRRLTRVQSIL